MTYTKSLQLTPVHASASTVLSQGPGAAADRRAHMGGGRCQEELLGQGAGVHNSRHGRALKP